MRLWHHQLLDYLPRTQLLAQWRELNSIYAKKDRHVLINYIYDYPLSDLYVYSHMVTSQMQKRGFQIRSFAKMQAYFADSIDLENASELILNHQPFVLHHDWVYLNICCFNLYEKYLRGQKDYSAECFERLHAFWTLQSQHNIGVDAQFLESIKKSIL